jgi:hypothetical protein
MTYSMKVKHHVASIDFISPQVQGSTITIVIGLGKLKPSAFYPLHLILTGLLTGPK